jgi:hypothetical protein
MFSNDLDLRSCQLQTGFINSGEANNAAVGIDNKANAY